MLFPKTKLLAALKHETEDERHKVGGAKPFAFKETFESREIGTEQRK